MPSYRIGHRAKTTVDSKTVVSESTILRSLFEVRKSCNNGNNGSSNSNNSSRPHQLIFWNCRWWSKRIIQSLTKLIVRDGQRFSSIKFFDCDVDTQEFAEILTMLLEHNAARSLVIKRGNRTTPLVGGDSNNNNNNNNSNEHQRSPRGGRHCESSSSSSSSSSSLSNSSSSVHKSILVALCEGMASNKSLNSLQLSGLNFEANRTTNANANANASANDNDNNCDSGEQQCNWFQTILAYKSNLRHLDLSNSTLCASTITDLSSALKLSTGTSLECLNLSRCSLDDRCLSEILGSLNEHTTLIQLNVSRNFLGASPSSTLAVDAVAELLRSKTSKLSCLDLSKQQPQPQQQQQQPSAERDYSEKQQQQQQQAHRAAFANALGALSTNTTLRRIDLSGNGACFEDLTSVEALTSCLVANEGLQHIDVSSCHLTPSGIRYLAQHCIPRCGRSLKSLVLFDKENNSSSSNYRDFVSCTDDDANAVAGAGAGAVATQSVLCAALRSNKTLESLGDVDDNDNDIDSNDNDDDDAVATRNTKPRSQIQHLLDLNRGGCRAHVAHDLPLAAWPHVLARAGRMHYYNTTTNTNTTTNNNNESGDGTNASCTGAVTASVLFALLRGSALLDTRR